MKTLNLIILLILLIAGCVPNKQDKNIKLLVSRISNEQIDWDGSYVGLLPKVKDDEIKNIEAHGKLTNDLLLNELTDPNKFVTAHYLLTKINLKEIKISSTHWNNLKISLHASGTEDYHTEQIKDIVKFWNQHLK